jgi:hypothetical protein
VCSVYLDQIYDPVVRRNGDILLSGAPGQPLAQGSAGADPGWSAPPAAAIPAERGPEAAAVPDVRLRARERVLWTGRPAKIPWWFGWYDIYFSAFFVLLTLAGGVYPTVGRIVHRRLRIRHSAYVVTDHRIVATWQRRGSPVVVEAPLASLQPPSVRGISSFTGATAPR